MSTDQTATVDEPTSEATEAQLLRKLWRLNLTKLIESLESGEVTASGLNVARQFLSDQGVTRQTLEQLDAKGGTLGALASLVNLPSFDDEPRRDDALAKRYAD